MTSRRDEAAVVPGDHVARIRTALLRSETPGYADAARACKRSDVRSWRRFRDRTIGARTPEEITVAYLAGPEPTNDLRILVGLGVRPENIWAFEVHAGTFEQGLTDLRRSGLRGVKLIATSMEEYLGATPRRFDIIYLDACGPLPSHDRKTTRLLATVFHRSALAPLGVLITNFARPDVSHPDELERFAFLAAAYFYPKGFLDRERGGMTDSAQAHGYLFRSDARTEEFETPSPSFLDAVSSDFDHYYGSFITRHILDVAVILAPTARLARSKLTRLLFTPDIKVAAARGQRFVRFVPGAFGQEHPDPAGGCSPIDEPTRRASGGEGEPGASVEMDGEALMDEASYSLLWTFLACECFGRDAEEEPLSASVKKFVDRWASQLSEGSNRAEPIGDLVAAYYAWRHDPTLWSPAMRKIADYPYRGRMPFLCDAPGRELGFFPAFAQLSYPAHANVREARRYRYTAEGRTNPMFLDVLAFDECRYVYDWLSALPLVPDDWDDLSAQLTFRFALDAIAKKSRWYADDFLSGCHAVGIDHRFPASELKRRRTVRLKSRST